MTLQDWQFRWHMSTYSRTNSPDDTDSTARRQFEVKLTTRCEQTIWHAIAVQSLFVMEQGRQQSSQMNSRGNCAVFVAVVAAPSAPKAKHPTARLSVRASCSGHCAAGMGAAAAVFRKGRRKGEQNHNLSATGGNDSDKGAASTQDSQKKHPQQSADIDAVARQETDANSELAVRNEETKTVEDISPCENDSQSVAITPCGQWKNNEEAHRVFICRFCGGKACKHEDWTRQKGEFCLASFGHGVLVSNINDSQECHTWPALQLGH